MKTAVTPAARDALLPRCGAGRALGRSFLHGLALVCLLTCLGFAALFAVAALPGDRLEQHVRAAAAEGLLDNAPRYLAFRPLDMFTECVGMGGALALEPSLTSVLSMGTFFECEGLRAALASEVAPTPYPRYIHGYQLVLKPVYAAFSLPLARGLTATVGLALCGLLFLNATRRIGPWAGGVLALSFILSGTLHVFMLLTHAPSFWLVLIGGIAALRSRHDCPIVLFAILGACDTFFSFLNMGSLSLGLPLLCLVLRRYYAGDTPWRIVHDALWCCIAWSMGFLLPWLFKWGLARLFLPPDISLFDATLERYPARSLSMIGKAFYNNFKATVWQAWLVLCAALLVRLRCKHIALPQGIWVLLFPALMPIVWICLLPGQSGVSHSTFVSIILWPTFAAILFVLMGHPRSLSTRENNHAPCIR